MQKYIFENNKWNTDDFMYVVAPHSKEYKEFTQEANYIKNNFNKNTNDFDYISLVTKEKFSSGIKVHTKCSFEKYGAPLIVITDDISPNKDGINQYGLHFEIVAYEEGCQVWHIAPYPPRVEKPIKPTLIGKSLFRIEENSEIDIEVLIEKNKLLITINGRRLDVEHPELPDNFHVGITACEGVNNFYEFDVES